MDREFSEARRAFGRGDLEEAERIFRNVARQASEQVARAAIDQLITVFERKGEIALAQTLVHGVASVDSCSPYALSRVADFELRHCAPVSAAKIEAWGQRLKEIEPWPVDDFAPEHYDLLFRTYRARAHAQRGDLERAARELNEAFSATRQLAELPGAVVDAVLEIGERGGDVKASVEEVRRRLQARGSEFEDLDRRLGAIGDAGRRGD